MRRRLTPLLLLTLATLLAGCGQKGPLYLPETPTEQTDRSDDASS